MASIKLKHSGGNGVIIAAPTSNPASDKTLTLPSDVDGTVVSKDSSNSLQNITGVNGGQLGNRNLVINGGMNVAQRQSASTSTQGYGTVDRFKKVGSGLGNTFSQEQITLSSSDTPYSSGFRKAFRVSQDQAGTANASGAIDFSHYIEAQNIAGSGWNYTSASSKITLQFWFRASTNQTFYGFLLTSDGTVQINPFSFTASGNNTWTKVTKTFTGNSNITINNDNGTGLIVYLVPYYGTDYQGSISLDTWTTLANNDYVPSMASTWLTAGASTFDVTGMQLEVGDTATDFEHRSFAQELLLCQRYYAVAGVITATDNAGRYHNNVSLPVDMRTSPTRSVGAIETGSGATMAPNYEQGLANSKRHFYQGTVNSAISGAWFIFEAEL